MMPVFLPAYIIKYMNHRAKVLSGMGSVPLSSVAAPMSFWRGCGLMEHSVISQMELCRYADNPALLPLNPAWK